MADTSYMVWIDQDLCTGDGICSEICPEVFEARDDGLWVVREDEQFFGKTLVFDGNGAPEGPKGLARIPDDILDAAVEAAEECPGDCIMIEHFDNEAVEARGV